MKNKPYPHPVQNPQSKHNLRLYLGVRREGEGRVFLKEMI
jgi:hypothetical protein